MTLQTVHNFFVKATILQTLQRFMKRNFSDGANDGHNELSDRVLEGKLH